MPPFGRDVEANVFQRVSEDFADIDVVVDNEDGPVSHHMPCGDGNVSIPTDTLLAEVDIFRPRDPRTWDDRPWRRRQPLGRTRPRLPTIVVHVGQ